MITGVFRTIGRSRGAGGGRRWLALVLLALLADLSVSAATHRHPVHSRDVVALEQSSTPASPAPGSPASKVSLDDICAICGALAGSVGACTSRFAFPFEGLLASGSFALRDPILLVARGWWDSTAARAPPRSLF